jgi:hypothetical protein
MYITTLIKSICFAFQLVSGFYKQQLFSLSAKAVWLNLAGGLLAGKHDQRERDNKFGLAADRKDSSNHAEPKSVAIGDDAIYQMAKQCLPVSSWPTAAIAVHLPEYPSILIDAKINSRSKPIKTQVDNFVAMSDQYFGQKLTTITEPQKKIGL